tara:strand:+ start:175 stop:360 length:186 start_codon:yes stop_codon:yes gene_type:complete
MNTKNLVELISSHVISISEDLDYGAEVTEEQKKVLETIASYLESLSEDVGMQNIVTEVGLL